MKRLHELAQEYAEETAQGLSPDSYDECVYECRVQFKCAVEWLLKKYSLVEKTKIQKAWELSQEDCKYNTDQQRRYGQRLLLRDLFPELNSDK